MTTALLLLLGAACLWAGGEAFVRGSVALAGRLRISELLIGLTLVGFGTSLPELVTSAAAVVAGQPGLAVGNIVGSNIANVLLIVGIAATIRPLTSKPEAFVRDGIALILATGVGVWTLGGSMITPAQAWLSIGGIVAYVGIAYWQERLRPSAATDVLIDEAGLVKPAFPRLVSEVLTTAIGLGAILAGAWLFIQGADDLVELFGVSGTFVGLFMVAVGTSLPELTISVVASVKKKPDVVLGNIIGSNLFNTLAIPGLIAAYMPFEIPAELQSVDLAVMVAATLLLVIFAATKMRISRLDGALFVVGYFAYLVGRATLA